MKLVNGKTGLVVKLGVLVTALLLGQQAMAEGTRASTPVDNTALVDYEVGGVAQPQLSATANFVVDRRVDFTLVPTGGALVPVVPGGPPIGDPDYFVEFLLTNTSNSVLDFRLALSQMIGGTVRGQADTNDMATVDYAIGTSVANGDADPVRGAGLAYVDELEADDAVRIRVYGDPALTMANGDVAGVDLSAEGREGGLALTEGGALTEDPNTDLGVENVFDNPAGGNLEVAQDGFIVVTADLVVTKAYNVIANDLGSGLAIPGATVEYTITIDNDSTTTAADPVQITDAISANVTFLGGQYAGGTDIEIDNGGTVTQCTQAVDADDCDLTAGVLTVGGAGTISLAADTVLMVSFQVTIPDPAVTP
jgi:uncharacterized repeat protein (TIGR01451 family)